MDNSESINFPSIKNREEQVDIDLDILNETIEYIRPAVQADGGDATGEDIYSAWRSVAVEKGVIEMYAGGGQPDYWNGDIQKIKVSIESTMRLDQC